MRTPRPVWAASGSHAAPGTVGSRRGVRASRSIGAVGRAIGARVIGALMVGALMVGAPSVGVLAVPVAAAAQFSVYPAMVEFPAASGVGTESLTIENQGSESIEVRVYQSDYDRTEDGGHTYLEHGSHVNSCRGRLQAFPDQLAVEPGQRGEIRLRLEGGSGTCWGIVFVEKRTLTASGITVAQRIGVKVLARSAGGTMEGRVGGMSVDTAGGRAAVIGFENEGEQVLDIDGEIEIRDMTGEILEVLDVDPFRVLPGRTRRVRVSLDDATLTPGRYVLVAVLDFGGEYLVGGQALLEVQP